jgi:hypothetical protein
MRLAVALCKGNGLVFRRMAQNLARATGKACLGGARVPFVDDSDDWEPWTRVVCRMSRVLRVSRSCRPSLRSLLAGPGSPSSATRWGLTGRFCSFVCLAFTQGGLGGRHSFALLCVLLYKRGAWTA